jgi:hypothetical protein
MALWVRTRIRRKWRMGRKSSRRKVRIEGGYGRQ